MSMTLADLKKSRSLDFSAITSSISKAAEGGFQKDNEDYFKLTKDKAGNGSAVIRFLPKAEGDELPWVSIYSHGFQGPTGRWYIENCLSTLGEDDPINIANRALWNGSEADKEIAKKQKRKLSYFANVYIVSDPGNRENEGKVKLFKFGKKIFDKITEKLNPTFEDDKPVNVFDLWEGANFKLRMCVVEKYPNYDQSSFAEQSPIADSDQKILEIVEQQKPLKPLLDAKNFKSYEELDKKFKSVMSAGPAGNNAPTREAVAPKSLDAKVVKVISETEAETEDLEDYFKKIAT